MPRGRGRRGRPPGSGRGRGRPPNPDKQRQPKRVHKDPYDLPISRVPLSVKNRRGERVTIQPIFGKGRCPQDAPYNGRTFPMDVPDIPDRAVGSDGRVAVNVAGPNGQLMERYLTHTEDTTNELFKMAYDYADFTVDTKSLPMLIREHAVLQQKFPNLPDPIESWENNSKISRIRWLTQGLSITRPAMLSNDQMSQLRKGAYWATREDFPDYCNLGKIIEDYYYHAGHRMEQRRGYRKKEAAA